MADTGDNLGDLTVNVTGDFSELQSAIDQSVTVAQSGSEAIASALQGVSDASGLVGRDLEIFQNLLEQDAAAGISLQQSLEDLSNSAGTLGEQIAGGAAAALEQLQEAEIAAGEAASGAAAGMEELGAATTQASEAAVEGESSFGAFGETLTELSGIVIGAEALKEFATEALGAYASVEKATIALTAMTGSAGQATEAIEGLKSLALTDALSFPSLVTAYQRMTAFGVSAAQIPSVLQAAADAAAATGKSFDTVTNSLTRMAISGTANARQLVNLGISLTDLAGALNVTTDAAAKTFKALDMSDRITALEGALQKYQGTAQAVAEGVAGQWQNLQTKTEFAFESMGEAIAPAAEAIMAFASNFVLPAVQVAANAYANLGRAESDFANAAVLAAATATNATKDMSLGIGAAVSTVAPGLGNLIIQFASSSTSAEQMGSTIKTVAQNSFIDAFLPAVQLGAGILDVLSLAMENFINKSPGADAMIQQLTNHLHQFQSAATMGGAAFTAAFNLAQAQAGLANFSGEIQATGQKILTLQTNIQGTKDSISALTAAQAAGTTALANGVTVTDALAAENAKLTSETKALNTELGNTAKAAKPAQDSLDALAKSDADAQTKFDNANTSWANFMTAVGNGKTTIDGVTTSANNANTAWNNLANAYYKATGAVLAWNEASGNTAQLVQNQVNSYTNLENAVAQTSAVLKVQQGIYSALLDSGTATDEQLATAQGQVVIALKASQQAQQALQKATDATGISQADLTGKAADYATVLVNGVQVQAGYTNAQLELARQSDATTNALGGTGTAVNDLMNKYANSKAQAQGLASGVAVLTKAELDNAAAVKAAADQQAAIGQAWADGAIVMQNYAGVLVKETTAATDGANATGAMAQAIANAKQTMTDSIPVENNFASGLQNIATQANNATGAMGKLGAAAKQAAAAIAAEMQTVSGGAAIAGYVTDQSTPGGASAAYSAGFSGNPQGMGNGDAAATEAYATLFGGANLVQSLGQQTTAGVSGDNLGFESADTMLQNLANATGQVVTGLAGTFYPATQAAAAQLAALQAEANATGKSFTIDLNGAITTITASTAAATAATTANTTATTASTAAIISTTQAQTNLAAAVTQYQTDLASGSATAQQLTTDLANVGSAEQTLTTSTNAAATATGQNTNVIVDNSAAQADNMTALVASTAATTAAATAATAASTASTSQLTQLQAAFATAAQNNIAAQNDLQSAIAAGTASAGEFGSTLNDAASATAQAADQAQAALTSFAASLNNITESSAGPLSDAVQATVQPLTAVQQALNQLNSDIQSFSDNGMIALDAFTSAQVAQIRSDEATLQSAQLAQEGVAGMTQAAQNAVAPLTGVQQALQQLQNDLVSFGAVLPGSNLNNPSANLTATQLSTIASDQAAVQKAELAQGGGAGISGTPSWQYVNPNPDLMASPTGNAYGAYSGSGGGVNLNVYVTGNSVTSAALVDQLANKVSNVIVTNLRTNVGLKT